MVRAIHDVSAGLKVIDTAIAEKATEIASSEPPPVALLSDREIDVLRLLAQGFTSKEIADQLSIGIKTVETYKSRATTKLDLHTRAQIVRFAAVQGWLADF